MYGKLFASMYDGTLALGPWQAIVTLQQLVILADADGEVDMTVEALSRRTTIPVEVLMVGIEHLSAPDPNSRTPEREGRRIVLIDDGRPWGWTIVNYKKYRDIRSNEDRKEYMRNYMRSKRSRKDAPANSNSALAESANSKLALAKLANAEADAEVDPPIVPRGDLVERELEPGEPEPRLSDTRRTPELVRLGFERRFVKATGNVPSWGPANARSVSEVARWLDARPDTAEALDRLLDGFFADAWTASATFPVAALAKNPAKYLPAKRKAGSDGPAKVGDWSDVLQRSIASQDDLIRHQRRDPKWERPES